jgi:hypothetical protein
MGNYSVEELAHMDRLRYKPKNGFRQEGQNTVLLADLRILNNLCFKPWRKRH